MFLIMRRRILDVGVCLAPVTRFWKRECAVPGFVVGCCRASCSAAHVSGSGLGLGFGLGFANAGERIVGAGGLRDPAWEESLVFVE